MDSKQTLRQLFMTASRNARRAPTQTERTRWAGKARQAHAAAKKLGKKWACRA